MTTEADRHQLLDVARRAIAAHVAGAESAQGQPTGAAAIPGGAFVTLHSHSDLRGCIGHIESNEPVGRVIARCAVAACSADPRFPPVAAGELADLDIEISLLGPLERIAGPSEIEVGRHGLVIESGWHRGLLLPQVATEWGWDAETFLANTCRKAGLPNDAWRTGARLWKFEAEVFSEKKD